MNADIRWCGLALGGALILAAGLATASAQDGGHSDGESGRIVEAAAVEEAPGASVAMTGALTFEPRTVTIRAGERVVWRNVTGVRHTVTLDPDETIQDVTVAKPDGATDFHSGFVEPGDAYVRTFSVPGRYRYICVPHQAAGMVGEIVVEQPDGG